MLAEGRDREGLDELDAALEHDPKFDERAARLLAELGVVTP